MILKISNYDHVALLQAFTRNQSGDSNSREKAVTLAKKLGMLGALMEVHFKGKISLDPETIEKIEPHESDLEKDDVRALLDYLRGVPTQGTETFYLYDYCRRLEEFRESFPKEEKKT